MSQTCAGLEMLRRDPANLIEIARKADLALGVHQQKVVWAGGNQRIADLLDIGLHLDDYGAHEAIY